MATCPICGNEVENGQVCWVCARADHDQKAHGGPSRVLKRKHARTHEFVWEKSAGSTPEVTSPANTRFMGQEREPQRPRPDAWRRLEGFSRLLKDVYGRDLRLSAILAKQGAPQAETRCSKCDESWLLRFVECLERSLVVELARILSKEHACVMTYWYGLAAEKALQPATLAFKLGVPLSRIHAVRRAFVTYLQGQPGQRSLERIVLAAALCNSTRMRRRVQEI